MQQIATATPAARTRTRRARDPYRDAAAAARAAQRKLAELAPKGPGPYAVLLAIVSEISLYSRLNDELGVDRLAEVTGLDRRTVQRALRYLTDHGVIERIVPPSEEGKPTPRAWIGLPWPPMTTPETPPAAPVENVGEGGAPDTPPGRRTRHPSEKFPEEKEVVCGSVTLGSARGPVRAGARPALPAAGLRRMAEAWGEAEPVPDPSREAERQAIAREIDRRRRERGTAA